MTSLRDAAQEFVSDYDAGGCGHFEYYAERFRKLLARPRLAHLGPPVGLRGAWSGGRAMSGSTHLIKALSDAIPLVPHPDPHAELVRVRLDIVEQTVDRLDWLEKGNAEWRQMALQNSNYAEAARATARVAISHLQAILQPPRTHHDQQAADTAARDWLQSIGAD